MIRLTVPSLEADDLEAVRDVLLSGFLVQGPRVAAFEQAVAQYVGTAHAVAVSSGTAALHLSLLALDVRAGDLVVVPAYSWPATANVVELCGAQPVFVDVAADTYNLDPDELERTLGRLRGDPATAERVKAIIPVHLFGQMADMPAILDVANAYGLPVIEDAACALGANWLGRPAGSWGLLGCFSFHPRKAITTGEGGIITTDDGKLAQRVRALRNHGLDPEADRPEFIVPGFNYRLTEFQAALGTTQLAKLERIIDARRRGAHRYHTLLRDCGCHLPRELPGRRHIYQSYVILLSERAAVRRARLIRELKEKEIETSIGTWHLPLTAYYRERYGFQKGAFPITDAVFERALTLPLHEHLLPGDQRHVAAAVQELQSLCKAAA